MWQSIAAALVLSVFRKTDLPVAGSAPVYEPLGCNEQGRDGRTASRIGRAMCLGLECQKYMPYRTMHAAHDVRVAAQTVQTVSSWSHSSRELKHCNQRLCLLLTGVCSAVRPRRSCSRASIIAWRDTKQQRLNVQDGRQLLVAPVGNLTMLSVRVKCSHALSIIDRSSMLDAIVHGAHIICLITPRGSGSLHCKSSDPSEE